MEIGKINNEILEDTTSRTIEEILIKNEIEEHSESDTDPIKHERIEIKNEKIFNRQDNSIGGRSIQQMQVHKPFSFENTFNGQDTLVQDEVTHTEQKHLPFLWDVYRKAFFVPSAQTNIDNEDKPCIEKSSTHKHIRGKKSFSCDICDKIFTNQSHLDKHQLVHIGEKPFSCDTVDQRISNPIKQKRIRTGEKPYSCGSCEKSFKYKSDLTRHKRIHPSEEELFLCDICEETFNDPSQLANHQRIYMKETPYFCIICNKKFCIRGIFVEHNQRHIGQTFNRYTYQVEKKNLNLQILKSADFKQIKRRYAI